eukprot:SAG31_NODE_3971_length_3705_cov_3.354964_4_plen_351_part_00
MLDLALAVPVLEDYKRMAAKGTLVGAEGARLVGMGCGLVKSLNFADGGSVPLVQTLRDPMDGAPGKSKHMWAIVESKIKDVYIVYKADLVPVRDGKGTKKYKWEIEVTEEVRTKTAHTERVLGNGGQLFVQFPYAQLAMEKYNEGKITKADVDAVDASSCVLISPGLVDSLCLGHLPIIHSTDHRVDDFQTGRKVGHVEGNRDAAIECCRGEIGGRPSHEDFTKGKLKIFEEEVKVAHRVIERGLKLGQTVLVVGKVRDASIVHVELRLKVFGTVCLVQLRPVRPESSWLHAVLSGQLSQHPFELYDGTILLVSWVGAYGPASPPPPPPPATPPPPPPPPPAAAAKTELR